MEVSSKKGTQHEAKDDNSSNSNISSSLSEHGKEAFKDIVFGSVAGVVGKTMEYPFDTVKVRLQAQPDHLPLRYTGPLDCFRQSLRNDGLLGLYRGVTAPLFGAAVETSSLFFSYRVAQDALRATILPKSEPLSLSALVLCGAISGAFTSLLLTPIELVKCKMQIPFIKTATATRPPSAWSIIGSVYRHHGVLGFWHGQLGTLIRETGGSAAWFGSYEGVKLFFIKSKPPSTNAEDLPVWQRLLAGAAAGMGYNFVFYPADTVKSRMQTDKSPRSFWTVASSLWSQHGLRGLYRGCGLTVGRAAPSSAIIFTVYESLKKTFG